MAKKKLQFTIDDDPVGGQVPRPVERIAEVLRNLKDGELLTSRKLMSLTATCMNNFRVYSAHPSVQCFRARRWRGGNQWVYGNARTVKLYEASRPQDA